MVTSDHVLSKRDTNGSAQHRNRISSNTNSHSQYKTQLSKTKSDKRRNPEAAQNGLKGIGAAAAHATLPSWATMVFMVCMIFGGCCSNVGEAS